MPLFVIEPIDTQNGERQTEPQGAQSLGHAAGVRWYKADAIPTEGRAPTTDEMTAANLELPAIRNLKASARRKIEAEVGDLHEVVADQAKQIEALTVMLCHLSAEYLGGKVMSEVAKTTYLARVQKVLSAIDSGALQLRGDLEGTDDMLEKTLYRTNRINEIVGSDYLPQRESLLN
ncbi:hypothetical protein [Halomonas sp. TD01]|uniref:hypothetical protein n=1 Tax=Halomonas sp. TD01 TaxID=999141 RepID=UPI000214E5E1|nr:hypothetical protein [Halomonas sp. TD01]EGP18537.1 hypothetical protein GME_16397 [Halomonas sp. TD01]CAH1044565.1 hypothetical protein HPTD01_3043 [Halomonas sp. TD01]